jgi:uncharacterized membrane protein YukC
MQINAKYFHMGLIVLLVIIIIYINKVNDFS